MKNIALFFGGFNIGATIHTAIHGTFDSGDIVRALIGIFLIYYYIYINRLEEKTQLNIQ